MLADLDKLDQFYARQNSGATTALAQAYPELAAELRGLRKLRDALQDAMKGAELHGSSINHIILDHQEELPSHYRAAMERLRKVDDILYGEVTE